MTASYRIEGTGGPDVLAQASAAAEAILMERAGVTENVAFLGWATYLLAAVCCAGLMALWLYPILESAGFAPQFAAFIPILAGGGLFAVLFGLFDRANTRRFWRKYCADPMHAQAHTIIAAENLRTVSGRSEAIWDWADIDRIEVTQASILVLSGFAWMLIPLSGFSSTEAANAALSQMRSWQAAARE